MFWSVTMHLIQLRYPDDNTLIKLHETRSESSHIYTILPSKEIRNISKEYKLNAKL